MHSLCQSPVKSRNLESSASSLSSNPFAPSLSSKVMGWQEVRQMKVRELALHIHALRQDEVMLSCVTYLGSSRHSAWAQAPMLLGVCWLAVAQADLGTCPAGGAAWWSSPVFCHSRGSHGSLGIWHWIAECKLEGRQMQGGHSTQNFPSSRMGLNCGRWAKLLNPASWACPLSLTILPVWSWDNFFNLSSLGVQKPECWEELGPEAALGGVSASVRIWVQREEGKPGDALCEQPLVSSMIILIFALFFHSALNSLCLQMFPVSFWAQNQSFPLS